jgi:hypothetical protein
MNKAASVGRAHQRFGLLRRSVEMIAQDIIMLELQAREPCFFGVLRL